MTPDTKAAWKRRALRAEAELEKLREMLAFDGRYSMTLATENAALRVAIEEIRESIASIGDIG